MSNIRITKQFHFETGHALYGYDGKCKNVHGHSYRLFVTLIGEPINDKKNPKHGMVIDFGDLKRIVNTEIVDRFDHTAVVSSDVEKARLDALNQMFGNVLVVDYQPTCENMVVDIANRIMPFLPDKVKLHNIRLFETATSYAEWFASDN